MIADINSIYNSKVTLSQEIKLSKPVNELYPGQILQALVVKPMTHGEVLININGQNINAKTSHHFSANELLQVKVLASEPDTILQILQEHSSAKLIQDALAQLLPKQAPASQLLAFLQELQASSRNPQLQLLSSRFLAQIPSLNSLAQSFPLAVMNSGLFFETYLAQWKKEQGYSGVSQDFKGQCIKLLSALPTSPATPSNPSTPVSNQKSIPVPGAVPQPLSTEVLPDLDQMTLASMAKLLRELTDQVVSRITSQQLEHLQAKQQGMFQLMVDLPLLTPQGYEVIPLLIEHKPAGPMQKACWSISLAINLAHYGEIQGQISLSGKKLDVFLNIANTPAFAILLTKKDEIATLISKLGLEVGNIGMQKGLKENHIDKHQFNLVDIKI